MEGNSCQQFAPGSNIQSRASNVDGLRPHQPSMSQFNITLSLSCQGLFFDEAYGFYPGQVLIGPAKVFSNVQWLSGVKPVLSRKSKFRVVVEEVRWTTSALFSHQHKTLLP